MSGKISGKCLRKNDCVPLNFYCFKRANVPSFKKEYIPSFKNINGTRRPKKKFINNI